jgi:hypothetical protein
LLPGLIDSHTHFFLDIIVPPELEQQRHFNGLFAPGMLLAIIALASREIPSPTLANSSASNS